MFISLVYIKNTVPLEIKKESNKKRLGRWAKGQVIRMGTSNADLDLFSLCFFSGATSNHKLSLEDKQVSICGATAR